MLCPIDDATMLNGNKLLSFVSSCLLVLRLSKEEKKRKVDGNMSYNEHIVVTFSPASLEHLQHQLLVLLILEVVQATIILQSSVQKTQLNAMITIFSMFG